MKYIRVETHNNNTEESVGGYISAIQTILATRLGVEPTETTEEMAALIDASDDPEIEEMLPIIYMLCDIPQPEVYTQDKQNRICLYQLDEFGECYGELAYISRLLMDETDSKMVLIYKEFDLEDDELLYEDEYQVVISKETYEKHKEGLQYDVLLDFDED